MFKIMSESNVNKLLEEVTKLQGSKDDLQDTVHALRTEKRQLQLDNKIEVEDIKHMTKIKEERLDIEFDKKVVALERKKDEEILERHNEYRDKIEQQLEKGRDELRHMYSEVLERLPNIEVALKGKVND